MRNTRALALLPAMLLLAGFAPLRATERAYDADLDAAQVVNPNGSHGTGSSAWGTMSFRADPSTLSFTVENLAIEGIEVGDLDGYESANGSSYHIHLGEAGERGPIAIDLGWYVDNGAGTFVITDTGCTVTLSGVVQAVQGTYDMQATTGLTPAQVLAELEAGRGYVSVHTHAFPGGEIRGALFPEGGGLPEVEASWANVKQQYGR